MPKRPIKSQNWVTLPQKKLDGADQAVEYVAPATTALHLQNSNTHSNSSSSSNNNNKMPLVSAENATTARSRTTTFPITATERAMELDAVLSLSSSGGNASWIHRVPWLRSRRDRDVNMRDDIYLDSLQYQDGGAVYHGGAMETASGSLIEKGDTTTIDSLRNQDSKATLQGGVVPPTRDAAASIGRRDTRIPGPAATSPTATTSATVGSRKPPPQQQQPSPFARIASFLSNTSLNTRDQEDESSLEDFDESEWTPQDSSYGAAIPIGGWIPKAMRRLIELSLIGLVIFGLAYFIVTTSMRLGNDDETPSNQNNKNGGNDYAYDGGVGLDDDNYIEYKNRNNNNDDAYVDRGSADDDAVADAANVDNDDAVYANDDAYVYVDDQYEGDVGHEENDNNNYYHNYYYNLNDDN